MEENIKGNMLMINNKAKEWWILQMEINMMENGLMVNLMDMELTHGKMGENIKGNMLMVENKAKEWWFIQMEINMMENGLMVKKMVKEHIYG